CLFSLRLELLPLRIALRHRLSRLFLTFGLELRRFHASRFPTSGLLPRSFPLLTLDSRDLKSGRLESRRLETCSFETRRRRTRGFETRGFETLRFETRRFMPSGLLPL